MSVLGKYPYFGVTKHITLGKYLSSEKCLIILIFIFDIIFYQSDALKNKINLLHTMSGVMKKILEVNFTSDL